MSNALRSALTLGLSILAVAAWSQPPTTPEQKARMIQLIDDLEKHPNAETAGDARKEVMEWLTDAPDVSVAVCQSLYGDVEKLDKEGGGFLTFQQMFAEARFMLMSPDDAKDELKVHLAGIEGVVRTYRQMQAEKPGFRLSIIEPLARMSQEGKLADYVKKATKKCH